MRDIVTLAGSDVFALTDSTDAVYGWNCADTEKLLRSEGKVSGVTLTGCKWTRIGYRCSVPRRQSAALQRPHREGMVLATAIRCIG